MGLSTQISGKRHADLRKFADELVSLNINVNHPFDDIFSNDLANSSNDMRYMAELELFQSIASSSFHTIDNADGIVDFNMAMQLVYAISKNKPVVLTSLPEFSEDVDLTIRDILRPRIHQLFLIDVRSMAPKQLLSALEQLPMEVDYKLSPMELHRIRLYGKTHFRELLQKGSAELVAA